MPTVSSAKSARCELLSPAGSLAAAYAALQHDADAVYLGLKKFSARADAANFTSSELSTICAYAHTLSPRRRIYVTLNTLILCSEMKEVLDTLEVIQECEADAAIVQDLGVLHLAKRYFSGIPLHASTQLGIHSVEGATAAKELGFKRVVLARELLIDEIAEISQQIDIETEVFIHGALCYSYSGLCLFSSLATGNSANRGRCVQPCREIYCIKNTGVKDRSLYFSMKDLWAGDLIARLRDAGVSSFKIEGRKKTPFYVAAATAFYRSILDGTLDRRAWPEREAELRSLFSRAPSLGGLVNSSQSLVDRQHAGHRGLHLGNIEAVTPEKGVANITFSTTRSIELHDGLQIDIPRSSKPFGFAVKSLKIADRKRHSFRSVVQAPPGSQVIVSLPARHPCVEIGYPVSCTSSQQVVRRYRHVTPLERNLRVRVPLSVGVIFTPSAVEASGEASGTHHSVRFEVELSPARRGSSNYQAVFEQLGETCFKLHHFELINPDNLFCPISILKKIKKTLCSHLDFVLSQRRAAAVNAMVNELATEAASVGGDTATQAGSWFIKSDNPSLLADIALRTTPAISEAILAVNNLAVDRIQHLMTAAQAFPNIPVRLALPPIIRANDKKRLVPVIERFLAEGQLLWEAASLGSLILLRNLAGKSASTLDISADWSCYCLNPAAIMQLIELGIGRLTLSPEDSRSNIEELAARFPGRMTLIVYQDTPLFISDFSAHQFCDSCRQACALSEPLAALDDTRGAGYLVFCSNCRSTVIASKPFSLAGRLPGLLDCTRLSFCVDFTTRGYSADSALRIIEALRLNSPIGNTHCGNFERGLY
jgi:putative protease